MTNAEVCDATLRVGMDADRKDNLYDMIDVKNSTLLVEPSSLRKLIASWNKKQRPIGAADSSAKQGAINNSSISDFSKDVNEQHPITKRPANLVKTDELIYNRSKENGSENPVAQIIVHELTHSIEGTAYYPQIQQMILDFYQADVGGIRAEIQERYGDTLRTAEDVNHEMIAEFFEKKGITDMDTLRAVVKVNRSFAEKVADWLQHLATKITGTKEQKFILEMRDRWREALLTADDEFIGDDIQYSLKRKRKLKRRPNEFRTYALAKISRAAHNGAKVGDLFTVTHRGNSYSCKITDIDGYGYTVLRVTPWNEVRNSKYEGGAKNDILDGNIGTDSRYSNSEGTDGQGYGGLPGELSTDPGTGRNAVAIPGSEPREFNGVSYLEGNYENTRRNRPADTGIRRLHLSRNRIFRLINQYGKRNTKTAKAFVTNIDPTSFLNLVAGEERANALRAKAKAVNANALENAETPFIRVNMKEGTVLGGDGLKRMAALEKAGVTEVTIVVIPEGAARNTAETIDSLELYGANPSEDISLYELIPLTQNNANEIDRVYGDRNVLNQISGTQYSISRRNDSDNRRVSQSAITARSVARENNQTEAENAIEENIAADREGYTYTPKSNRETEEQAWANREAHWYDEDRLTGLFEQVESAQGAELDNLTTELILEYVDAVNSGDMARASRIQEQRGKLGTVIGRALQTNTLLRKLTPEGFLNDATAKLNRDYARRNGFSPAGTCRRCLMFFCKTNNM